MLSEVQGYVCPLNDGTPADDNGPVDDMDPKGYPYPSGGNATNGKKYATGSAPGQALLAAAQIGSVTVHTAGANYLACDGHAKYLTPNRISVGRINPKGGDLPASQNTGGYPNDGTGTESTAAGVDCLDNLPADFGKTTCATPNGATLTFSNI